MLLSAAAALAQDAPKVSYEEFKAWMKQTTVNGFSFVEAEQDNGDYTASFMQLNKMISVRISSASSFEKYKHAKGYDGSLPYDLKGVKSMYVSGPSTSTIYIVSPQINATIIISTTYCKLDKPTMEKVVADLGLGAKF